MAFTIGTTKVLNLPEQVEENVQDISHLNTVLENKQDSGTAVNDTNLKSKVEALDSLDLKSVSVTGLVNSGNTTNTGTLTQEGTADFGSDVEVGGKLTINSVSDLNIKDGSSFGTADVSALTAIYNSEAYQFLFANLDIYRFEEGRDAFDPSATFANIVNAISIEGICQNTTFHNITKAHFHDMLNLENANGAFRNCNIQEVELGNTVVTFNEFFNCESLTKISVTGGTTVKALSYQANTFHTCRNLTEIGAIDMSNVTNFENTFLNCPSLKSLHCTHWKVSFDISASTQFEEADLVEIIGNLDTVSTAQTLTIGATNFAKLTQDEILAATGKGWTLK